MKIQYASDLHLEFSENWEYLKNNPIKPVGDVLLLAGDILPINKEKYGDHPFWDWCSDNFEHTIAALGNRELYGGMDFNDLKNGLSFEMRDNVHYYYNCVVEIEDMELFVTTLWTNIDLDESFYIQRGMADYRNIFKGGEPIECMDIKKEHFRCLRFLTNSLAQSKAKKRVVMTHHVPSELLTEESFLGNSMESAYTVNLTQLIEDVDVNAWIYGHSHKNIERIIGNTLCTSNQLGYVFQDEHQTFMRDKCLVCEGC